MDKRRKKSAVLFAYIFVVLGMWMMLSVHCQAVETNNDEKQQPQIIRIGSFEDTFNYVDKNGDDSNLRFSQEEAAYRELFTRFCEKIAIQERINPELQRNMLPLWMRKYMIEFSNV